VIAGRYDLVREIGRGGMGAVWLGRDTVLGREVALKRVGLMPGTKSPDLERAEREARLAARLNHPHVVSVFDLVDDGDDTWLVMEYVEGITVSALVQRDGALTPEEAAPLARQAADALAAAHGAGIVHRDVKPSNMLVDPHGQVKLSDFGIARAQADASLTQTGLVTGSPAYLAPEVASGRGATAAADVWSLGASLFHLLEGHPPYDVTENLMGALYQIVHEEPPRVGHAGWLAPLLEHTMTRDPADRWTMAEVRDFLDSAGEVSIRPAPQTFAPGEGTQVLQPTAAVPLAVPPVAADPTPARPPSTEPGPRRRRSPWPWVAALAVVALVAVIAGAAYLGSRGNGTPSAQNPRSPTSSQSSSSSSSTSPATDTSAAMEQFLTTYLTTVTSDRKRAFAMLTPDYQSASGGYGGYSGFWSTITSARASHVTADPSAMTVTYDVAYTKTDGGTSQEHHTLQLVADGSSYLISDQLS
jgi:serine/threonine protein kinase